MSTQLRVVTLNCWGLFIISKDREKRMQCIGDELARGRYDVVTLQEVWMERDYRSICEKVKAVLPHHHYFHSGLLGSGMCILSRWPILDVMIHRYSLNSYAHHILEGDWFAGKGVGLAVLQVRGLRVNVYTTHETAMYAPYDNQLADDLFTHRLLQSYELSEFVRMSAAAGGSELSLVTGDFNLEEHSLGQRVARANADLRDAWMERPQACEDQRSCTVDARDNCYTPANSKAPASRIDYILYGARGGCRATCRECRVVFEKIPGTSMNYSDHSGVEALLDLSWDQGDRSTSSCESKESLSLLREILPHVDRAIQTTRGERLNYLATSLLVGLLLVYLWLTGLAEWGVGWGGAAGLAARLAALLVVVALVLAATGALCLGAAVKSTEVNQLVGRRRDVALRVRRLESMERAN